MDKKSTEKSEKKSWKTCLVVTIAIVVLLNLGIYFYYGEISKGVTIQYNKFFGDDLEDLNSSTIKMTINNNEKDTTTESITTTTEFINPTTLTEPLSTTAAPTTTTTTETLTTTEPLTTTSEPPTTTSEPITTIEPKEAEFSGSGGAKSDLYDDEDYGNEGSGKMDLI